ncbi:phosphatase PAP2 family protein [Pedobacter nutrimenti]|uniref:phosphatase PAP2 family protein n=1 Tax=Pedobacter nutrimenti TaxID=1241337 RepID=UPI00292DA796|nr:phosphatase PAP2 family protein [Pedobacter nutrimenti]
MPPPLFKKLWSLPYYFLLALAFALASSLFIFLHTKEEGFILLNPFHTNWLDLFFMVYTNLGDGLTCLAVIILLLICNKRKKAITLFVAFLSSGMMASLLKIIFHQPRPKLYFQTEGLNTPAFMNQMSLYSSNSFPSGHTTTAFALATVLVLVYKKNRISIPCLLGAILVGYSRIYLAQHFPADVLAGMCVGVFFGMLSYHVVYHVKVLKAVKKWRKSQSKAGHTALKNSIF